VIPLLTERLHCGLRLGLERRRLVCVIPLLTERLHCGTKAAYQVATDGFVV